MFPCALFPAPMPSNKGSNRFSRVNTPTFEVSVNPSDDGRNTYFEGSFPWRIRWINKSFTFTNTIGFCKTSVAIVRISDLSWAMWAIFGSVGENLFLTTINLSLDLSRHRHKRNLHTNMPQVSRKIKEKCDLLKLKLTQFHPAKSLTGKPEDHPYVIDWDPRNHYTLSKRYSMSFTRNTRTRTVYNILWTMAPSEWSFLNCS